MTEQINIHEIIAKNPGIDAAQLEEYQRSASQFGDGQRYKYNLVAPFAGRLSRHQMAECGGPDDNVRERR